MEYKELNKRISDQISAVRKKDNLTQEELAEKSGLKASNISRIENGHQNLSLEMVERIFGAMELKPSLVFEEIASYDANTEYCLKLYDDTLMRFKMLRNDSDISVNIISADESNRHLWPAGLKNDNDSLRVWLKRRSIPQNRAYVREILQSVGINCGDIKAILDLCLGLSLEDSYWVVPASSGFRFDEKNLFENPFSPQIGQIAFVGMSQTVAKANTSSPEFTTGGMLRKGWRRPVDKHGVYLYKGGTEENTGLEGNEPFSEYYAYQIATAMGLNAVEYNLERWKGILSSVCPLFTSKDVSFVPMADIEDVYDIEDAFAFLEKLGQRFVDEFCDMLVFDVLICNRDRHFGNFGLLRDNRSGNYISFAPIFDNGQSLFCFGSRTDFDNLDAYAKKQCNPYEVTTEEILKLALHDRQKKELKRLKDFSFQEHPYYNLPEWRLHAIEDYIRTRSAELEKGRD